jgi:ABC-2 type transport system ATP-binding protein
MLQFESVSKKFGSINAVDDLSFQVGSGSVVGLLGPNGAGKSTAMRILLGLSAASSGKVTLLGHEPGSTGFAAAIRRTGSHIERPALYERATARQNLEIHGAAFGIGRNDPKIATTLETIGLSGRSGDKVKNFSLGMRQRMSLGVAILHDPELVVLDEPTNGLDPSGVVEIREVIRSLPARGMTCLVSSHVLGEIEKTVDEVVIIRNGRLVAEGPIDEIVGGGSGALLLRLPSGNGPAGAEALAAAGLKGSLDGDSIRVEAHGKSGSAIAEILANAGIYPDELRSEGANLEDVFINLTSGEAADER